MGVRIENFGSVAFYGQELGCKRFLPRAACAENFKELWGVGFYIGKNAFKLSQACPPTPRRRAAGRRAAERRRARTRLLFFIYSVARFASACNRQRSGRCHELAVS
jgi:hypothetical protein